MFSTRKLIAVALVSTVAAGCAQRIDGSRVQQLSDAPIIEDEAMALRQWDQTTALYANGTSRSYPTMYPYVPQGDVLGAQQAFTAHGLFFGQTLLLPITAVLTPPWQQQTYRGLRTPPTYTAVPVVEPDAVGYALMGDLPGFSRVPVRKY